MTKSLKAQSPTPSIVNLNKSYRLNEALLKEITRDILRYIKRPLTTELEFVFLDDRSMKAFNKRYKNRFASTDVLSFKIGRREFGSKKFLGEIFICLDTALRNSKIFGTRIGYEVTLYMIHGILHLFGYDDGKRSDRIRMAKKEGGILSLLCERRDLSKVLTPR